MSLLTEKTQLQEDLEQVDQSIMQVAEASNHLASTLHRVWYEYWALPTDRLLAVLNADIARTLAIFEKNTETGEAINSALDAVNSPRFASRAPVVVGREDIVFDANTNQFVVVEPEEEPEP